MAGETLCRSENHYISHKNYAGWRQFYEEHTDHMKSCSYWCTSRFDLIMMDFVRGKLTYPSIGGKLDVIRKIPKIRYSSFTKFSG
jgi:hypothetical protein